MVSSGLGTGVEYDVYVCTEDDEGTPNRQAVATLVQTATAADVTAPSWGAGYPRVLQVADFSFQLAVEADEPGSAAYVLLADGATSPSSAQVVAGQDSTGAAAISAGVLPIATPGAEVAQVVTASVQAATDYKLCAVLQDDESTPNLQAGPLCLSFSTTADATPAEWEAGYPAVASITDYVAATQLFVVLAGPWSHEDGSLRDERAWFGRGWCRMEQLANALSPTVKPLIIAQSTSSVISYGPAGHSGHNGWFLSPVGRGRFTVPEDIKALGPVISQLLERRKAQALRDGDLGFYRHLHALGPSLLEGTDGEVPREKTLDEWMAAMHFTSVHDDIKSGLTPLRYAVLNGRADLAAELLDLGADIEAPVRSPTAKMTNTFLILKKITVLGTALMAACSGREECVECVKVLLERGANLRSLFAPPMNNNMMFMASSHIECTRLVMERAPDLANQSCGFLFPFEVAILCGGGSCPVEVIQSHVDLYKDILFMDHPPPFHSGRHRLAAFAVSHVGSVETLRILLDAGADANGYPEGVKIYRMAIMRWLLPWLRRRALKSRGSSDFADVFGLLEGASPLHVACCKGNLGAVRLLLERGAKLDSTNSGTPSLRMTPLMYAALRGHEQVVRELLDVAPRHSLTAASLVAMQDKRGKRALDYANLRGHEKVVQLLREN